MNYRTKAAMRILIELTRDEALELLNVMHAVQDILNQRVYRFTAMNRATADKALNDFFENKKVIVPQHIEGHYKRFMRLMVEERAPEAEFLCEYNYALFKADSAN